MKKLLAVPLTALALTFGGVATAEAQTTQPVTHYAQTTSIQADNNDHDDGGGNGGLWGLLGLLGLLGLIPIRRKPSGPDPSNFGNVGRTTRP